METVHIDHAGRLHLSGALLEAIGSGPDEDVVAEITSKGLLIRSGGTRTTITDRIAAMDLPVGEWDELEQEIEAGRMA